MKPEERTVVKQWPRGFCVLLLPSASTFTIHRYASSLFLLFTLATRCKFWSLSSLLPFISKTICQRFSINVCSKLVPRAYLAIKDANPRLVLSLQESVSRPNTLASSSTSLFPLIETCPPYGTFYAAAHSNLREAAGSSLICRAHVIIMGRAHDWTNPSFSPSWLGIQVMPSSETRHTHAHAHVEIFYDTLRNNYMITDTISMRREQCFPNLTFNQL